MSQYYAYTFLQWLLFFYCYCFFGWCFESTYVSIKEKHWINRGFLKGPFLPIYGSGAIIMLIVSAPFKDQLLLTYIAGVIGATTLELVTGYAMESLFKVRYWDYSNQKYNYHGYICLSSSVAWGFFTIGMTKFIQPAVEPLILDLPQTFSTAATYIITVVLVADFTASFKDAMDLRDVLIAMEKAKKEMAVMQRRLDVVIAVADDEISRMAEKQGERIENVKSATTDKLKSAKETAEEKILSAKETAEEKILSAKETAGEKILSAKETAGEKILSVKEIPSISTVKTGELIKSLESRFGNAKDKMLKLPGESASSVMNEYRTLQNRFQVFKAQHTKLSTQLKSPLKHNILSNPTMYSKKYKAELEQLREYALKQKK